MLELRTSDLVPAAGRAGAKLHPVRTARLLFPACKFPPVSTPVSGLRQAKGRKCTGLLHSRCGRRRCNPLPKAQGGPHEGRGGRGRNEWRKKRVIIQSELPRLTRPSSLRSCARLPPSCRTLPEGSVELRNAHTPLLNTRRALARPDFRPRSRHPGGSELSGWKGVCSPKNPGTALPGVT